MADILDLFVFLLVLVIALLVVAWRVALTIDVVFVGHDKLATRKAARKISDILKIYHKEEGLFYDLGSCRGSFLVRLTGYQHRLRARGIDISHFRTFYANACARLWGRRARFIQGNFFNSSLADADAVYVFLDQEDVSALEGKLAKELKPGSIVITNTQRLPTWPLDRSFVTHPKNEKEEKMFVYVKS